MDVNSADLTSGSGPTRDQPRRTPGEDPVEHDFATELARCGRPPLVLLESHANDGTGHCEVCPAGADGSGRLTYPCNVRSVAVEALVIQARLHTEKDPTGQNVIWLERGAGPERLERHR